MEITKGELKEFLASFGELYEIEDPKLQKSLCELSLIIDSFFLFDRPNGYILDKWEVDEALGMSSGIHRNMIYGIDVYCSLYPYFTPFKRKKQLNLIL